MIDEQVILTAERLRDDLGGLKGQLRKKYSNKSRQVTSEELKTDAARLAETWLADLSQRPTVGSALAPDYLADLTIHFQRLLVLAEHASKRSRYDAEINSILRNFSIQVVIPLKKLRTVESTSATIQSSGDRSFKPTAFVGHSFAPADQPVVDRIVRTLVALGITVVTGIKPKAESISEKVKGRIDGQHIFVGVFTRKEKLSGKDEWTTSPWTLDEKAYAVGKRRKLILIKEVGVGTIGGIQGDHEFLEFSREQIDDLLVRLIELFDVSVRGLA